MGVAFILKTRARMMKLNFPAHQAHRFHLQIVLMRMMMLFSVKTQVKQIVISKLKYQYQTVKKDLKRNQKICNIYYLKEKALTKKADLHQENRKCARERRRKRKLPYLVNKSVSNALAF